jgi:hypothetical protein
MVRDGLLRLPKGRPAVGDGQLALVAGVARLGLGLVTSALKPFDVPGHPGHTRATGINHGGMRAQRGRGGARRAIRPGAVSGISA